ncbi:MAG TPA: SdiA-regulated domain-containing protein [Chitinophagaceae bacterium]|nr:SdiA-regulated domain-containing protein [Chitinophagaceae bacterium]
MQRFKLLAGPFYISCFLFVFLISCKPKKFIYKSPPHYNFSQELRMKLDLKIKEISGVVWDNHKDEFIAHNDEKGTIFYLDKNNAGIIKEFQFSTSKGDYEDIAIAKNDIYVLRSDGMLYKIVTDSAGSQKSFDLGKIESSGQVDFETLYYDPERNALIMLCKNCAGDDKKLVSAYAYYPDSIGFVNKPIYSIDVAKVKELSPRETSRFQPSAARIHPVLKKLFILSSASNQLVIADMDGNVEGVYMLSRKLFPQAEGLTFKSNGEMFISNEGVGAKAELLKFNYMP